MQSEIDLVPPGDVRLARDLPESFLLGTLEPGSFRRDAHGWEARYVDRTPGTGVRVRYVAGGPFLAFPAWRGLRGMTVIDPGNSWVELSRRFCENGIPESWERTMRARIEAMWSLGFRTGAPRLPAPEDPLGGPEYVILFPSPDLDAYREASVLLNGGGGLRGVASPVSVSVEWVYRQEKEMTDPPTFMEAFEGRPLVAPFFVHAWPDADLPALTPFDPDPPKGSLKWWPRLRKHDLIVVRVRFRDLERVLDLLDGVSLLPEPPSRLVRPGPRPPRRFPVPPARLRGFIVPAAEWDGVHEYVFVNGKESVRVRYTTESPLSRR